MRRRSRRRSLAGLACLSALALLVAFGPLHAANTESDGAGPEHFERIDLNKATAEGLTAIPGIGKTMADRIVDWREEYGPFRRVEDLMKVKGIPAAHLRRP